MVLAPRRPHFYVASMTCARLLSRSFSFSLLLSICLPAFAQFDAEEIRRLQGELADLREANLAYQKQISDLRTRLDRLQGELRDANERHAIKLGDFATREDLKKIIDRIAEVDNKRENDRKVILEEFEKLGKTLISSSSGSNGGRRRSGSNGSGNSDREKEPEAEPVKPFEGRVLEIEVKKNQTFGELLQDFNKVLKDQGLRPVSTEEVKRANPRLNPNRIFEGQKILFPVPDKK